MHRAVLVCFLVVSFALPALSQEQETGRPLPRWSVITVMPGDTLDSLANRYQVSSQELCDWNELAPEDVLEASRRLRVLSLVTDQERFMTRLRIRHETTWRRLARDTEMPLRVLLQANRRRRGGAIQEGTRVVVYLKKERWNRMYLDGGVQLETTETLFVKHPEWAWGRPVAVRTLEFVSRALGEAFPGSHLIIGDLSRKRGGRFPPHKGHKGGLDADIGLLRCDKPDTIRFFNLKPEELDVQRMWFLVRTLIETGRVERILLDSSLQRPLYEEAVAQGTSKELLEEWFQYPRSRRIREGVIQHYPGHRHHIHVRFIEPESEPLL